MYQIPKPIYDVLGFNKKQQEELEDSLTSIIRGTFLFETLKDVSEEEKKELNNIITQEDNKEKLEKWVKQNIVTDEEKVKVIFEKVGQAYVDFLKAVTKDLTDEERKRINNLIDSKLKEL